MFSVNDVCVARLPSHQNAIDLFENWSSALPARYGVSTNGIPLFEDGRVAWAIEQLGGVAGRVILELGPLEGGHTFMLEEAGAQSILAIEGNKTCFLKCLVARAITDRKASTFLLGDFVAFLQSSERRFDIVWVAGVLYHMQDPVELIRLISNATDAIYVWTHYMDEASLKLKWSNPVVGISEIEREGRRYTYYHRSYEGAQSNAAYSGGVYAGASWMRKEDIMQALDAYGFKDVVLQSDDPQHPNGPALSLVAKK